MLVHELAFLFIPICITPAHHHSQLLFGESTSLQHLHPGGFAGSSLDLIVGIYIRTVTVIVYYDIIVLRDRLATIEMFLIVVIVQ